MSILANILSQMASGYAYRRGRQKKIVIGRHGISHQYVKPQSTEKRIWENDHYVNGCIYLGDSANPVIIDIDGEKEDPDGNTVIDASDAKVISTEYLYTFMKNKVIKEALNTAGTGMSMEAKMIIANIVMTLIIGMVMVGVASQ